MHPGAGQTEIIAFPDGESPTYGSSGNITYGAS